MLIRAAARESAFVQQRDLHERRLRLIRERRLVWVKSDTSYRDAQNPVAIVVVMTLT